MPVVRGVWRVVTAALTGALIRAALLLPDLFLSDSNRWCAGTCYRPAALPGR